MRPCKYRQPWSRLARCEPFFGGGYSGKAFIFLGGVPGRASVYFLAPGFCLMKKMLFSQPPLWLIGCLDTCYEYLQFRGFDMSGAVPERQVVGGGFLA